MSARTLGDRLDSYIPDLTVKEWVGILVIWLMLSFVRGCAVAMAHDLRQKPYTCMTRTHRDGNVSSVETKCQ